MFTIYNPCNDYEEKIIYNENEEDACKKCEYLPDCRIGKKTDCIENDINIILPVYIKDLCEGRQIKSVVKLLLSYRKIEIFDLFRNTIIFRKSDHKKGLPETVKNKYINRMYFDNDILTVEV